MKWELILVSSVLLSVSSLANASDYGCKDLLCLANPNGATVEAECVPPMHQLWDDLVHLRAFPTCDMAVGPNGQSYYDLCPTGTTELSKGGYAIEGIPLPNNHPWENQQTLYTGIGTGDGLSPDYSNNDLPLPGKICVSTFLGTTDVQTGNGGDDGYSAIKVSMFDRVVMMRPQSSPRIIDVFIDNQLFRRVRW